MRQQREHNRRVIAECARRAPRGLLTLMAIGASTFWLRYHVEMGGPILVVAGAVVFAFFAFLVVRRILRRRTITRDPLFHVLLDRPEQIIAVQHSRDWWTDTFRIIAADGAALDLAARGTLSRRLAVSLAAHCSSADVSTPWVSRSPRRRPAPTPAPGGLPFA